MVIGCRGCSDGCGTACCILNSSGGACCLPGCHLARVAEASTPATNAPSSEGQGGPMKPATLVAQAAAAPKISALQNTAASTPAHLIAAHR